MGSKKSHSYLARLFRRTPKKEFFKIFLLSSLNLSASYCYLLSLEGGEVDYLLSIVEYLAGLLIASLLINIFVAVFNWYTCEGWVRGVNFLLQVTILFSTLSYDLGTDIMSHGQYNLLVYFLLFLPVVLLFILYKFCKLIKRLVVKWKWCSLFRFIIGNMTFLVFSYLYVQFSIKSANEGWYLGLEGQKLASNWPKCSLEPPGLPWPSMLPHRTLNFFSIFYSAGFESCGYRYNFSTLQNNFLQTSCKSPGLLVEQPDYISMRDDMFVLTETGFEVYNDTKSLEKQSKINPGCFLKRFSAKIDSEWFSVQCEGYENYHIQNVPKPEVLERLKKADKKRTTKPMNLILFMMDTTSRQHFFRKMDEMVELLENFNKSEKFETFQFFRIISNGFNTEFNTRAMYSGSQLKQERRGRPYWDFFSGQGNVAAYINGFCEDWMSVFMRTKFKGMDHKVFYPWCHPEFHPFTKTFGNFAGPFSILRRCINGIHVHDYIFNYIHEMWKNYKNYGKIIHVSFQEGHEGTGEVLRTLSPSMAQFFKTLDSVEELENTVVFLTSDHGSHMGPYFMSGEMGKFEQKLPLLITMFPKKFLKKYPEFREKLKNNQQNLVSHYDTYWTLRHLATLPEFGGEITENREQEKWHQEVWDCELNLFFMEVVHLFRHKLWRKSLKNNFLDMIQTRVSACFKELEVEPKVYENLTRVDYSQLKTNSNDQKFYVADVIKNLDILYWFEDAYQDVSKNYLKGRRSFNGFENLNQKIKDAERDSWESLKAPGIGRYLFGRSLMRYDDVVSCEEAGIVNCVCSEKSSIHNQFSNIG